jgi:hypothetical protein
MAFAAAPEGVNQRDEDAGARSTNRVTERYGASTGIHFGRIEFKLAENCDRLRGKGLVQFEQIDLVRGEAGAP